MAVGEAEGHVEEDNELSQDDDVDSTSPPSVELQDDRNVNNGLTMGLVGRHRLINRKAPGHLLPMH